MWSKETSIKIANILNLIAEPPNVRPHPRDASIKLFDGGIIAVITGQERLFEPYIYRGKILPPVRTEKF
jgi:hypothetical protein